MFDAFANSSRKFKLFSEVKLSAHINKLIAANWAYSIASSAFSIQAIAVLLTPHDSKILARASRTKRLSWTIKIFSSTDTIPIGGRYKNRCNNIVFFIPMYRSLSLFITTNNQGLS